MPYKRRYKRKSKRYPRSIKSLRKNRYNKYKSSIVRAVANTGPPDTQFIKFKYVTSFARNTMVSENRVFRMNSCHDPDIELLSEDQPMAWDQYKNLYSAYQVYASKITVRVNNLHINNIVDWVILPSNFNVAHTTLAAALEQPYVKWGTSTGSNAGGTSSNSCYMTIQKLESRPITSLAFQASITTDPVEVKFWNLQFFSSGGGNLDINVIVEIIYYTKMFERTQLTVS